MPTAIEIAKDLAEALPRESSLTNDIVAVGMVAQALISEAKPEARAGLVDMFCESLRSSLAKELN